MTSGNDYIVMIEKHYDEILRSFIEQKLTKLELIDYLIKGENIEHIKTDYNELIEDFANEWVAGLDDYYREQDIEDKLLRKYEDSL